MPSPGMVTLLPQRQLRQKLGGAYHPEGRLFIYIDNCGVFCWNGRFRAVRHPYGFKGGCCAEEVDSLHGGPFSAHWGRGSCLMSGLGASQSPAFERKESSPLIRCAPPDGLRLLIFLQPLGRALKNQNAAPTAPPCFSRRLRSSLLLFKSSYPLIESFQKDYG